MKRFFPILGDIWMLAVLILLVLKLVRVFGGRGVSADNMDWLIGGGAAIFLVAVLGWYCRKRFFSGRNSSRERRRDACAEAAAREWRAKWRRDAVILRSTPATELPEGKVSCLGRVTWQLPGEEQPVDAEGKPLDPLATIFVSDLPGVPKALRKVALITVFASEEAWSEDPEEKPQLGCVIRTYSALDGLVPCNYVAASLKPCVLTPEPVTNDMPQWPDCGGEEAEWDAIRSLEKKCKLDYHEDICGAVYATYRKKEFPLAFGAETDKCAVYETHKIGGYPAYIQDPIEIPEDYPFVMQITSDFDAGLYIADCGIYYFYYNAEKNDWRVYAASY